MALDSAVYFSQIELVETSSAVGTSSTLFLQAEVVETTTAVGDSAVTSLLDASLRSPIQVYTGPTEGEVNLAPQRHFSPVTGDLFFVSPPARHFSSPTGGRFSSPPLFVFSTSTSGEVGFAGVPPAISLVATPAGPGRIVLTWVDVSNKESGFRIERTRNGQGMWTEIATVPANTTLYHDTTATPLVVFDYRVIAFNANVEADPSNIATAYSPSAGTPPPPQTTPPPKRILEFLSPGVYGLEEDLDGNVGGNKF